MSKDKTNSEMEFFQTFLSKLSNDVFENLSKEKLLSFEAIVEVARGRLLELGLNEEELTKIDMWRTDHVLSHRNDPKGAQWLTKTLRTREPTSPPLFVIDVTNSLHAPPNFEVVVKLLEWVRTKEPGVVKLQLGNSPISRGVLEELARWKSLHYLSISSPSSTENEGSRSPCLHSLFTSSRVWHNLQVLKMEFVPLQWVTGNQLRMSPTSAFLETATNTPEHFTSTSILPSLRELYVWLGDVYDFQLLEQFIEDIMEGRVTPNAAESGGDEELADADAGENELEVFLKCTKVCKEAYEKLVARQDWGPPRSPRSANNVVGPMMQVRFTLMAPMYGIIVPVGGKVASLDAGYDCIP